MEAGFGLHRGDVVYASANGIDIEHGAAGEDHGVVVAEEVVEQGEGIGFVLRRTVGLLEVERADKVVTHAGLLPGRGGCRADGELAIELAGVGVEDGTTEAFGPAQGVGGLAHTRGAEDDLKGLFHGGKGEWRKKKLKHRGRTGLQRFNCEKWMFRFRERTYCQKGRPSLISKPSRSMSSSLKEAPP